jgi:PAS domain S-box-containing protein
MMFGSSATTSEFGGAVRKSVAAGLRFPRRSIAAALGYLACLGLLATPVHALDPNKRITQYIHSVWTPRDGSVPNGGYAITQTSDGFLWFVSGDLMTFDGVRFAPWDGPPNYGSISTNDSGFGQIVNAFADHAGGLWVFGLRGIVHLKGRVLTSRFELAGLRAGQNFSEDKDGSIWVARGDNSVSDLPLCHITDQAVKCFGKADGIPISPLNSLLADGKGGFWLGGQTALVHWYNGVSETYPINALKSNAGQPGIKSLALGPDGSLWVGIFIAGHGRGLGRLTKGVFQSFVTPSFDGSTLAVHSMIFDRDGNLWVGSPGQGLFRITGNVVDHYGRAEGLSSNAVDAVFVDREGVLWTAAPDWIHKFRDSRVASFSTVEGLGNFSPMGVLATKDGTIWVANLGSLDHIEKNGSITSIRARDGLPGNRVTSMLEDHAGNMWVGVDDGLYLFRNGQFRRLPEPNDKPLGLVVGITEDVDGNIWAECFSNPRKLVRIRDFQVREEFSASQVPTGRTIAPDPRGGIWIGTLKGDLALFRHGVAETFPLNAKGDPFIRQIVVTADGSVLAGSAEGLTGLRQGKVQRMTTRNGLPCNFVTSFIEDREKRWWLYTDCGIVELPDSELQRWWTNPEVIVPTLVYDELDGAHAGRPNFNSAAYSADGRIWFASGVLVQMLDPFGLSRKAPPAPTYIQSLTVDRKEFAATENIKLSPHPHDLQIDYTSPSFLIPQKVKFRYRLDGYDRDWKEAGTRRQAFYTDLPPGKYSFRVIASNSDGIWSNTAAQLGLYIAPAYNQTTWFRALLAAAVLALMGLGYQLRIWRVQRESRRLRDVIETIPAYVWSALPDGSVDFINRRWLEFSGFSLDQAKGWGWADALHPEDRARIVEAFRGAIAAGKDLEAEARMRGADGRYRWLLFRSVPQRDPSGKIVKWYGKSMDITELKRAGEERERLRQLESDLAHINRVSMLGELAASIAHEVNQPLAGIVSNGSACLRFLAVDPPDIEEIREGVRDMVRDGKRAGEVIARIRALTKRTAPPREKLDLNETIREVLALVGDETKKHGVVIRMQLAGEVCSVEGDRVQLQQVLLNLIMNAIQAMSGVNDRARQLVITTRSMDTHQWQVTVEDSGMGLDPEKIARIFEPFYTTKSGGMGMGLSICRSILQHHGGRLWATANDGPGASFHFTLPKHQEGRNAGAAAD